MECDRWDPRFDGQVSGSKVGSGIFGGAYVSKAKDKIGVCGSVKKYLHAVLLMSNPCIIGPPAFSVQYVGAEIPVIVPVGVYHSAIPWVTIIAVSSCSLLLFSSILQLI